MIWIPETRYAKHGDVHIAYQVIGHGPLDLVFLPNWANPIDLMWHQPDFARFLHRLASFSRLICFDKRGSGRSDRGLDPTEVTLEGWMDDITMVMRAAGSARVVLFGYDAGGLLAMLFAASYPDRTAALVLLGTFARLVRASDHPWGLPSDVDSWLPWFTRTWGTGSRLKQIAPSVGDDEQLRSWWGQYERAGNNPEAAAAMARMHAQSDVRHVLSALRVPTLVVHRTGDLAFEAACGRYLAEHIPGAKYVEVPGVDHLPWVGDQDAILDEIEAFLTGVRPALESDRVLATVLFTDIVESTRKAAEVGDRRWRELLDRHDEAVRRELERHRGNEVKTTGDGLLATFDGPARAVRCACAIRDAVRDLGIEVRAGLHTGEIELRGKDVAGVAVAITRRVCDRAEGGQVLVSRTVTDLVAGSGLEFEDRGEHELKGVPGRWQLYAVAR
jgi:class 3 adenylate cyclase